MPTATETPRRQCPGSTGKKGVKDTVSSSLDSADEQPKRSFNVRPDDGVGGVSKTKTTTPKKGQRTPARTSRAPGSMKKENQLLRASTIKDNQDTPKRSNGSVTAKPDTPVPLAPRALFSNGVSILRQPIAIHSVDLDNDDMEELLDEEGEDVFFTASEGKSPSPVPAFFKPKAIPELRVTSATPPAASSPLSPVAEHHDANQGEIDFESPVKSTAPAVELASPSEDSKRVDVDHRHEAEGKKVANAIPASDAVCGPTVPLDVQVRVYSVNSAIKLRGREQLESDILELEAHVKQLQSEKIVVERHLATLKDKSVWQLGQQAHLAKQKETINTLRGDLGEALKSKARQIGAAVEAAERQLRDEMSTKITELRANCRKLQGQRDQFLRSSQTLRRDVIKGKRDKAALLKEKQELGAKVDKLEEQINDLYEWAHSLADEALASATENETLRAEAEAKELDNEALRTRVQELEAKVKEQQSQIKVGKQVLEQSIKDRARDADSYDLLLGAKKFDMIECKAALQGRELELEVEKKRRRKAEDELVRARAEIELLCSTQTASQGSRGGKRARVE